MAEHVEEMHFNERIEFLKAVSSDAGCSGLCKMVGSALQQLGDGVQQHLQQGQLPAALTVRAVEACDVLRPGVCLQGMAECQLRRSRHSQAHAAEAV
jgi:hypothetical protein